MFGGVEAAAGVSWWWWAAAGGKDPLWIIPEAGHNEGWKLHRALYEARVRAFFDRHLLGRGDGLPAGPL